VNAAVIFLLRPPLPPNVLPEDYLYYLDLKKAHVWDEVGRHERTQATDILRTSDADYTAALALIGAVISGCCSGCCPSRTSLIWQNPTLRGYRPDVLPALLLVAWRCWLISQILLTASPRRQKFSTSGSPAIGAGWYLRLFGARTPPKKQHDPQKRYTESFEGRPGDHGDGRPLHPNGPLCAIFI